MNSPRPPSPPFLPGRKLPAAVVRALPGIGLVGLLALARPRDRQGSLAPGQRHQRTHPRDRPRHARRQHGVPPPCGRRRRRGRVLEADAAACRHHSLRAAPDLSGHRQRRHRRRDHRCAGVEQHLRARLVGGHPRFRTRSQDGALDRGRQLDLRRGGRHGGRARGAWTRRASHRGRLDGRGVRNVGDLSLPGALPLERALPAFDRHPRPLRDLRRLDHSRGGASRGGRPCRDRCRRQYGGDHQDGARHDARALSHPAFDLSVAASRARGRRERRSAHPSSPSSPPRSAASSFPGSPSGSWRWRRSTRFWSCRARW